MEYVDVLQSILAEQKKRLAFIKKELSKCPEGKLYQRTDSGKQYLLHAYYQNGKRTVKGITKDKKTIEGLVRRALLEREKKILEFNIKEENESCLRLKRYSLNTAISLLKDKYSLVADDVIIAALKPSNVLDWENKSFEQSKYLEEEKTQITRRGLKVRSKSELLIAEALYDYNLAFHYEEILYVGSKKYAPDFTIKRTDGKIFYWEHFGLTNNPEYIDHQVRKLKAYAAIGVVPWDNLIVTFDNSNGSLDIREIRSTIENKLLR